METYDAPEPSQAAYDALQAVHEAGTPETRYESSRRLGGVSSSTPLRTLGNPFAKTGEEKLDAVYRKLVPEGEKWLRAHHFQVSPDVDTKLRQEVWVHACIGVALTLNYWDYLNGPPDDGMSTTAYRVEGGIWGGDPFYGHSTEKRDKISERLRKRRWAKEDSAFDYLRRDHADDLVIVENRPTSPDRDYPTADEIAESQVKKLDAKLESKRNRGWFKQGTDKRRHVRFKKDPTTGKFVQD